MKMAEPRRLIRPVERQPMREWLIEHLDSRDVPGVEWTDRSSGEFRIKWCHGSRHGWSIKDADLFEKWAKHTGRYSEDKKDPKKWKANFRCALNSRKDIQEITRKDQMKGSSAYRVYRMKGQVAKDKKRLTSQIENRTARKTLKFEEKGEDRLAPPTPAQPTVEENPSAQLYSRINSSIAERKFESRLPNFDQILPDFEKLEYGKSHVLPRQGSGFMVQILQQPGPLKPIPGVSRQLSSLRSCQEPKIEIATQTYTSTNTYPLTPEDSEASHVTDDEDMEFLNDMSQEVEVCQEITIESSVDSDNYSHYVITDISNSSHRPITTYQTSHVMPTNSSQQPITDYQTGHVQNTIPVSRSSYPLTPP